MGTDALRSGQAPTSPWLVGGESEELCGTWAVAPWPTRGVSPFCKSSLGPANAVCVLLGCSLRCRSGGPFIRWGLGFGADKKVSDDPVQGLTSVFSKEPENKYFQLRRPDHLPRIFQSRRGSQARDVSRWACCPNNALLTTAGAGLDLAHGPWFAIPGLAQWEQRHTEPEQADLLIQGRRKLASAVGVSFCLLSVRKGHNPD